MVNWHRFTPTDFEYDWWTKTQDYLSAETKERSSYYHRMANMKTRGKAKLSRKAIDKIVVAQADDDSAWTTPVRVRKAKTVSVPFSSEIITRAAFFARLHRESRVEAWLKRVIQERIDLEEAAFAGLKRDLGVKSRSAQPEA